MDNIINKKNEYVITKAQFQSLVQQKKLIQGALYFIRDDGTDLLETIDLKGSHSFTELLSLDLGVYIVEYDADTQDKPSNVDFPTYSTVIANVFLYGNQKTVNFILSTKLYTYSGAWGIIDLEDKITSANFGTTLYPYIVNNLSTSDATKVLSATQGKVLNEKIEDETTARINADNLKINKSDIVDNLLSNDSTKVLSAKQGKVLQDEIETIKNSPDVVDIVAIYDNDGNTSITDIVHYDTTNLGDNDIVRCLSDNNPSYPTYAGQSTYYKWHKHTSTWEFIGGVGDYYTKGQVNALLSEKANDNAVVKLTGDQTINGKKTFVKNIATQGNLLIVNSNGDILTELSGTAVKTGYTGFLFKGNWTFNKYTQSDFGSITDISNTNCLITATTDPNKSLVLYNGTTYVTFIDLDLFDNLNNIQDFSLTDKTIYYLNHTANATTWSLTDGVNTILSNVSENILNNYGIYLQNKVNKINDDYQVELLYIKSEFTFNITSWYFGNYYAFISGNYTIDDVTHNFSVYGYQSPSQHFARNFGFNDITYNFGADYQASFSVNTVEGGTRQEAFNVLTKIFTPESSLQTQTVAEAYCIVYDKSSDSVKIGYGYFSGDNFVLYENTSESVATREDSSQWTNEHFAKWNAVKNQFEDSGKSASDFATAGQGAKADTAVQPMEIDTVSTSPITLADNKWFRLGTIASLTLNNPATVSEDFTCMLSFIADTNIAINYSALTITWSGDDIGTNGFEPVDGKSYDIVFYNNSATSTASLQAIVRGV